MAVSAIVAVAGAALGFAATGVQMFPPLGNWMAQTSNQIWPNQKIPPDQVIEGRKRGYLDPGEYEDYMSLHGFDAIQADHLWQNEKILPDLGSILTIYWRENKSDGWYYEQVTKLGIQEDVADLYKEANRPWPSPGDLVTWEAREVFEPDSVQKYGLDGEFGRLDLTPFEELGMTREQVKNYWRAHWEHPSFTQMRELIARTELTEDDFWEWFRLVEIPPYWRDLLINIAYRTYTRVDARRMHRMGVFSDDQLVDVYMELGYDEEHASKMADFTIRYNKGDVSRRGRDLTRTMIEDAWELGMLTDQEAKDHLEDMNYSGEEADFIMNLKQEEDMARELSDQQELIIDQLMADVLDIPEAKNKLADLGMSDQRINVVVSRAQARKEHKLREPTKADVKSWLKHGVIDENRARGIMATLDYPDKYIDLYVQDWAGAPGREKKVAEAGAEAGG